MTDDKPLLRTLGGWMAAAGGGLMLVNAGRAFADPAGFAVYLGLPLAAAGDAALIQIYGLRALFIGLLVGGLIAAGQRRALFLLALAAVVMPVGDALLARHAGASGTIVARHCVIALFLLLTALALALPRRRTAG